MLAGAGPQPLGDGLAIAHPSKVGEAELAAVAVPALLCLAESDSAFPQAAADAAVATMRARGLRVAVSGPHAGTVHGFAARGDETVTAVAAARAAALQAVVEFALSL